MPTYIDVTPTWGEWGNVFFRFAVSGESQALAKLHRDFALAMSAAEAFGPAHISHSEKTVPGEPTGVGDQFHAYTDAVRFYL